MVASIEKTVCVLVASLGIFFASGSAFGSEKLPRAESVDAQHGMVVTVSPVASEIGVEVLKDGGNAVDAAVAVAFAMAVSWPEAGNIGGGGFMLVHPGDGRDAVCIDYRE
ncbi:MAG: gamma-glutamyltransferase, partial [Planctomycetaceae bacterium]|nr:gamma-glutamyltransferase [Planctomycetaceae bacterium]